MNSSPTMDRTSLFFSIADTQCKQRGRQPVGRPRPAKTVFGTAASRLGRALHAVEGRIERIGRLANKSSLFDDPAAEINEIMSLVREEMSAVGRQLEVLNGTRREGQDFQPHTDAVLAWLQARLNSATAEFKAAVKQREAMQTAKEERAAKLSGISAAQSPFARPAASPFAAAPSTPQCGSARLPKQSQLLHRRRPPGVPNGTPVRSDRERAVSTPQPVEHSIDMAALGAGAGCYGSPCSSSGSPDDYGMSTPQHLEHQRQFWTPRSAKHRAQEVSQMQSTLSELGSMFERFGR